MHARIRRIRNRWRSRRLLRLQRFVRDESGLQLVEVTIVLPIFLMLFAATAEFGRYYYEYTTLAKNVRDASRYLTTVYPGQGDATAQKMIVYGNPAGKGSPIFPNLTNANVKITYKGGAVASIPDTVTVEIIN
ncbi:MAG TPA: TadE family protein, partial [Pyrinomonadaceae bacterium]